MKSLDEMDFGMAMLGEPVGRIPRAPMSESSYVAPDVINGVNPREPVGQVLARMKAADRSTMPLVDRDGRLLGFITMTDIHRWMRGVVEGRRIGRTGRPGPEPEALAKPVAPEPDLPAKYRLTDRPRGAR